MAALNDGPKIRGKKLEEQQLVQLLRQMLAKKDDEDGKEKRTMANDGVPPPTFETPLLEPVEHPPPEAIYEPG